MKEAGRDELALNIIETEWQWLQPHLERDALITVSSAIDLAAAAERIAVDDAAQIGDWIRCGALGKPAQNELARWEKEPAKKFLALIVSPYVLIQEIEAIN